MNDLHRKLLLVTLGPYPRRVLHSAHMEQPAQGLASDGFHPGPQGYAVWAESLSAHIRAAVAARAD
ncbi:MAG: hypothetical protein KGN32_16645 [Burkholderiales bacterium]|nr:hypothetical protein [Burkholderiales bacterium]